ncbi:MAG: molybdopterin molybdotransferase MoeA [Ignavibacteriae bacterium]|nr:molybdopterin molybdotransferase MoeA [Ignavibacteriota bacterium]
MTDRLSISSDFSYIPSDHIIRPEQFIHMINADKALDTILNEARVLSAEKLKLRKALRRTLAEDVVAKENVPPFDCSAMDGYAVRSDDTKSASERKPVTLIVIGESSAGNVFKGKLTALQAVRVMTGGTIPKGADSVVPVEQVVATDDEKIQIAAFMKPGAHIRNAGEDIARDSVPLQTGDLLTPAKLGVLASLGYTKVKTRVRPHVKIITTGDELVSPGAKLSAGQIRNSNRYTLSGLVEEAGAVAEFVASIPDKRKQIRKGIAHSLDCDILLITGGVSVGKYDLVKDVLSELGVQAKFWQVNIKPGKPLFFGTFEKTLVFGLPGNPVSAHVTFLEFVRPAILSMLGATSSTGVMLHAILDQQIVKRDAKRHFIRGIATSGNGVLRVSTTGTQSSGALSSMAKANCLIVIPENVTSLPKGRKVTIEMLTS